MADRCGQSRLHGPCLEGSWLTDGISLSIVLIIELTRRPLNCIDDLPENMGEVRDTVPAARPVLQVSHLLGLGESLGTVSGPELDDGG